MTLPGVYLWNKLTSITPTNLFKFSLKKLPDVFSFFFFWLVAATRGKKCQQNNLRQPTAHSGQIHDLFPIYQHWESRAVSFQLPSSPSLMQEGAAQGAAGRASFT